MRFMLLSFLIGLGLFYYITGGKGTSALTTLTQPQAPAYEGVPQTGPAANAPNTAAHAGPKAAEEPRMVQIQGKWYKYRADNRYVIDGVPTYHVPKKLKPKEGPVRAVAAQGPAPAQQGPAANVNYQKSQALIKMASENPMKVYTPEGFKALKDGLDAMKNSSAEQNKALEALMREP